MARTPDRTTREQGAKNLNHVAFEANVRSRTTKDGFFWVRALYLIMFGSLVLWVMTAASPPAAISVIVGGIGAIAAGMVIFLNIDNAGADLARSVREWRDRSRFFRLPAYWRNERRLYRWQGTLTALLGLLMALIGLFRLIN